MVGHASINLMPMNVSAIQVLMAPTVIVTMTSVHHNLAEMEELVQMVLPSIIANVRRVLQVCLSVVFRISLVKNRLTDCGIAKKVKFHFGYLCQLEHGK